MITMKEVAEKAGVSLATVSRVINGNTKVNPEIKEKVIQWIEKLGYEPNITAQSLASKRSNLIGVIVPDISNPYFSELVKCIEDEALKYGYNLIFHSHESNISREEQCLKYLVNRGVDGMMVIPHSPDAVYYENIKKSKTPVVTITGIVKGYDGVGISHEKGGALVAEHLYEQGHTEIGYLGPIEDEKFKGFKEFLSSKKIEIKDENIIKLPVYSFKSVTSHRIDEEIKNYLKEHALKVSALFAYNDWAAFKMYLILQKKGIKIPENLALAGFDDTFLAAEIDMTSIQQPMSEIARLAFKQIMNKLNSAKSAKKENECEQIKLVPKLIVRGSTSKKYLKLNNREE